jgi:hypothetical protein
LSRDDLGEAYSRAGPLSWEGRQPVDLEVEPLVYQVLQALAEGELTVETLARRLEVPVDYAVFVVSFLFQQGRVWVSGSGASATVRLRD